MQMSGSRALEQVAWRLGGRNACPQCIALRASTPQLGGCVGAVKLVRAGEVRAGEAWHSGGGVLYAVFLFPSGLGW